MGVTMASASLPDGPPPGVRDVMTSAELGELLHVSQTTLCRWRRTGDGPRVLWLSSRNPRYLWVDVHAWLQGRRS